jgi:hypothetical protein
MKNGVLQKTLETAARKRTLIHIHDGVYVYEYYRLHWKE